MPPFNASRPFRRLAFTISATVAFTQLACGGHEATAVTEPVPTTMAPIARAHLEELFYIMEHRSINRKTIDWAAFKSDVLEKAGAAQSIPALMPAIRRAITLLHDGHSSYVSATGTEFAEVIRPCSGDFVGRIRGLTPNIAYVRVPALSGTAADYTAYAERLQDTIRFQDRENLAGWVVDLRGNAGGAMFPMLTGLGPLLDEGVLGYFLEPDGRRTSWAYRGGASFGANNIEIHRVGNVYRVKQPGPRIAVLYDNWVASSGEAVAISLRGQANTRSFGVPTCGRSTGNAPYFLRDGARLAITESVMLDRNGVVFGDQIAPDEILTSPEELMIRAVTWLQTGR